MAGTAPPLWQEVALISIKQHDKAAREFMAITETIDISEPDYPGESIVSIAGGRLWKQNPEEDGEVTIELYPIKIDEADDGGLVQQFRGGNTDATDPLVTDPTLSVGTSRTRPGFLVAILWTTDAVASDAITAHGTNQSAVDFVAKRFHCRNARFVSHKSSFTEGVLKVTVTFKFPPVIPAGTKKNWYWESSQTVNSTTTFPALTYTTSSFDTATDMPT